MFSNWVHSFTALAVVGICVILAGILPVHAQRLDTMAVGNLWQIDVVVRDAASTPSNIIPTFNVPFTLPIRKGTADADTSIFKLWSLKDNPRLYHGPNDTFWTPIDSSHLDTCYGTPLPGRRYFILTSLDSGTFDVAIATESVNEVFDRILFYYPNLRYYDSEGHEITAASSINLQTGEFALITVMAYRPDGTLDTNFSSRSGRQWLRGIVPSGSSLQFYNTAYGADSVLQPLSEVDSLLISKGVGNFFIKADEPINGDAFSFRYTMYSQYSGFRPITTSKFPGSLQINYGDAPMLDSAAIYDDDGDGLGDNIIGWFSMAVDSLPIHPVSSWPTDSALDSISQFAWVSGVTSITFQTEETAVPSGSVGAGDLSVIVTGESGNKVKTTSPIKDRIGPVIQAVTILPGREGAPDTLVARFNKELDSTFSAGEAFLLNGEKIFVTGEPTGVRTWTFVLDSAGSLLADAGDSLRIAVGGGIEAADGNLPSPNNHAAIIRGAGTLPAISQDGNGFFDTNGDGKLDSIAITFTEGLTADQLDSLFLSFVWKDTLGNPLELRPNPAILSWNVTNPTVVSWKFNADSLGIQPFLTSVEDPSYGYGNILSRWEVNGEVFEETFAIPMSDHMSPVLASARIWPVSSSAHKGDSLSLIFSEPVDTASLASLDFLDFLMSGSAASDFGVARPFWSDSGRVLGIRLAQDTALNLRPDPGDSLRILLVNSGISDWHGNTMRADGHPVMLTGNARVLTSTSFRALIKDRSDIGSDAPLDVHGDPMPISVTYWNDDASLADLPAGSLGMLLDVGQSTVGDLDSIRSTLDLDLSKIGMDWRLDVFTNMGGAVATSHGTIACDDTTTTGFAGNCFENRKQVYISWNLLADNGRKAGMGVYVAKLTMTVWGKKPYELEKVYLWGVAPCSHRSGILCRE